MDHNADKTYRDTGKPVSFRAPPDLAKRIEAEAGREMLSVSAFVRRAVLQSLALSAPDGL